MRDVREQPRVVAAKVILAVCLVAVGFAIGVLVAAGDGTSKASHLHLVSARHALAGRQAALAAARAQVVRANATIRADLGRIQLLRNSNQRLRRELHVARQTKRHRGRH